MDTKRPDASEDEPADDRGVPEKQIQRWKNDGGAVLHPDDPDSGQEA